LPAYPLPRSSIEAALAALAPSALAATQERIAALIALREKLAAVLRTSKDIIETFPSRTNFLLARCVNADALYGRLLAHGVVVRNVSRQHALTGCLRITAGSEDEIAALGQALEVAEPSP
jgi:histidinol-phosphate aminotransferase